MKLAKFAFICAAAVSVSAVADDVSNEIAILPVAKTLNAMPLTVNFTDAEGHALSASNIVKTAGLPSDSALYVYDKEHGKYTKYVLSGTAWTLANDGKIYTINPNGQLAEGTGTQAEANPVPRGAAVFLETSGSATFYVAGTPGSGTITTITPGANLIGAPTAAAFKLNNNTAVWSGISNTTFTAKFGKLKVAGDMIQVPTADGGASDTYYYKENVGWGKFVTTGASATNAGTTTFVTEEDETTIPAGLGFWYIRQGDTNMTITW